MTCHYPDLDGASDWLKQISLTARSIRSTTQIWVVTCHQYGISELVPPHTSFGGTSGDAKFLLFPQARSSCQVLNFIQLFRERLSVKVHATTPKGIMGG